MNRIDILESMYEVIKDSLEWGLDTKEYGYFVDGVVAMVEEIGKSGWCLDIGTKNEN